MIKKISVLTFALLASSALFSTAVPRWQDPAVFEVNREPMRSTMIAFPADVAAVPGADFTKSSQYRNIGGEWNFFWTESISTPRPDGFFKTGFNDSQWGKMPVPGLWELNGYGDPLYTNHIYPWANFFRDNPPFVPEQRNAVGLYRRNIEVPAEWKGKDIFVHIGSATSNLTLWINGKEVGYSEDSKLEAEFNITSFVTPGRKNLFAMQIFRWCDGSYLEDQDFWRLSGISRDCYIYCREKARAKDVKFTPDLSSDYKNGVLAVNVDVTSSVSAVDCKLLDASGKLVADSAAKAEKVAGGKRFTTTFNVNDVKSWSAEQPNLYRLELVVRSGSKVSENLAFNVGFRKVEIKNAQLLVNGRPVLIKGTNRHEMNAERGYYVTREDMLKDIRIFKELNINAVRTCHYPNSAEWYDLCDEYGIYVVDEGNIESHGMGYGSKTLAVNPLYHDAHLIRDQRMVYRDYNHPSIIVWSLGNESGNGQNFFDCYDWIKSYDKSRPVQYEQAHQHSVAPDGETMRNTDIVCPMYADYDWCEKYSVSNNPRPLIQCEYAHSMGNSLGGFKEYWDIVRKYPKYQGGFIWDYADQALAWKNPDTGKITYRFGGDYNGRDVSDGNFNCNGFVASNRTFHPGAYEVQYQYQNIWTSAFDANSSSVTVYNENFFISLDNYALEWAVLLDGKTTELKGRVENLDVPAQSGARVALGFSNKDVEALGAGEKVLRIHYVLKKDEPMLKAGTSVARAEICLSPYDFKSAMDGIAKCGKGKGALKISDNEVSGDNFSVKFNDAGWIESFVSQGRQMLASPLMPQFYRSLTDNDAGVVDRSYGRQTWIEWRNCQPKLLYFEIVEKDGNAVATAEYKSGYLGADLFFTYTVHPTGAVSVRQEMRVRKSAAKYMKNMLRFGMEFAMPGEYASLDFYGLGPWETYSDRKSGAELAVFSQKVSEQFHQYYVACGESGTHADLRWMKLSDGNGAGLCVCAAVPFLASALPYPMSQTDRLSPDWRKHPSELEADGLTHVNVDYLQQGLGCVNSWGKLPREEYVIPFRDYSWEFVICPNLSQAD